MSSSDRLRIDLLMAIEAQDGEAFERAVGSAFAVNLPHALAELFAEALTMPWHTRHEDLASGLQKMKVAATVEALSVAATAQHAYLDYDEFFGLHLLTEALEQGVEPAQIEVGQGAAMIRIHEIFSKNHA